MAKLTAPLLPSTARLLGDLGERLRLARRRRRLTATQVSERAGMSPMTLRSLERGGPGVTIGAYAAVMQVLGIEGDVKLLAQSDAVGRELQDSKLARRGSVKNRSAIAAGTVVAVVERDNTAARAVIDVARPNDAKTSKPRKLARDEQPLSAADAEPAWVREGGFITSRQLAASTSRAPRKRR